MADKPSRALILYGDGLMRLVGSSHAHLHSLASRAVCGFMSLPNAPSSETEDNRILREFAELLDASESDLSSVQEAHTIPARFMGMKAALVTGNVELQTLGSKLGLSIVQNVDGLPADTVALELLKLLGFQDGKTLENSQYDMVLVHVGENACGGGDMKKLPSDLDFVNSLVGNVMEIAHPGSEIGSRLHFSVVMSYGEVSGTDGSCTSILRDEYKNFGLAAVIPRQSYTMKGGHPRENVRHHAPMLVAQVQDGVTRKDRANAFTFEDFKDHGSNLTIPVDRLLHEVAFKLWKAPKYGA
ncbi:unnamed protein product [Rhodiola kirilowii]